VSGRFEGLDAWRAQAERDGFADYDAPVSGIIAEKDRLILKVVQAFPQLPALLTQPWSAPLPKEAVRKYGTGFAEHPVGSGAYSLTSSDPVSGYTMRRHPGFEGTTKRSLTELRFEIIQGGRDGAERVALADQRFARGDLTVMDVFTQNRANYFTDRGILRTEWTRKGVTAHRSPALEISYLVFNFKHNFLKVPAVRQAIALAINRQRFVEMCEGPGTKPATGPLPSALPESELVRLKNWEFGTQDLERAKRLLVEAGFPDGKGIPELIVDLPGSGPMPGEEAAMNGLITELAKIGLKVQLRKGDFQAFMNRAHGGELQIAWLRWYADYPDAENFLTLFRSNPENPMALYNYGDYQSKEYDVLYDQMRVLYPGPKRSALIEKMLQVLAKDIPWVPLYDVQRVRLLDGRVKKYSYNLLNLSLKDVEVTEKR
jgi:ABC-type transport system substrate-binding protein